MWVKAGDNAGNIWPTRTNAFSIVGLPPTDPTIVASPTAFTNGNVTVTINYTASPATHYYSTNGVNWYIYSVPLVVDTNNITVYARSKDSLNNYSQTVTLTVANIDKTSPTVAYGTNGGSVETASTTVTVSDTGVSGLSILQYVWDTQNVSTPGSGWLEFTNGSTITKSEGDGTYYLWVKASDNAGNNTVSKTNVFIIDNTDPTVVFGTNGGIHPVSVSTTVTVSDPSGLKATTLQYVWDTQNVTTPASGWTVFTNGTVQTKTGDGTYYLWIKGTDNIGNMVVTKSNVFIVGEVEEIVSTIQTVNKTFSGATTGFTYNNPVIPAGFVAVNTFDAIWNNLSIDYDKGLVIQDASGNQFVWVPVKDGVGINGAYPVGDITTVQYKKWCTTAVPYTSTSDDTLPSGFNVSSITTTYKGFYIARYESAFDYNGGNIRAASKKSSNKTTEIWTRDFDHTGYLWNYVNYTDSKAYAESMDTSYSYDTTKVRTNLINGTQWDTVMKWIQNSGMSVTDSREWGNFNDSRLTADISGHGSLQISGFSYYWKSKNIYDLSGNICEWNSEVTMYSTYINRAGDFVSSGSAVPAAYRNDYLNYYNHQALGFRVGLYIL